MDQMAKGLLFGAAVLSQAAAGCFPAAAASIDRVRIRLAAEELDEMGMPVLEAESRDRAYSVTGVERISGDPASGPAMDRAELTEEEEIYLEFPEYAKFVSREHETKEEILKERRVAEMVCYKCRRTLRKKIRWFSSNQKFYFCLAVCPEHGYMKGKIRMKKSEDGSFFAVKTTKLVGEEGAAYVEQKKEETKKKRAERNKAKKSGKAAEAAERMERMK